MEKDSSTDEVISHTSTGLAFKDDFTNWFGPSKVVDAHGKPLVVYHGTASEFSVFDGRRGRGGFYFTDDLKSAQSYAEHAESEDDDAMPRVVQAYLVIKNPMVLDRAWYDENVVDDGEPNWEVVDHAIYRAQNVGNDGLILRGFPDFDGVQDGARMERTYDQFVAFRSEQIRNVADCFAVPSQEAGQPKAQPTAALKSPSIRRRMRP